MFRVYSMHFDESKHFNRKKPLATTTLNATKLNEKQSRVYVPKINTFGNGIFRIYDEQNHILNDGCFLLKF